MLRTVLHALLASILLVSVVARSASAEAFLTFGGSLVGVRQHASREERPVDAGFGIDVGGTVPLTTLIVVSGGLGFDSHGLRGQTFEAPPRLAVARAPRLALGLMTPGLYFNGEESKAIFYF